jgi:thioredoxin reductase (NADPH)
MSDYLIKEIGTADNLEVRYHTEVVDGAGQAKLDRLILRDTRSGKRQTVPAFALFVLIGAHPHTDWLPDDIQRDEKGFILTGADVRTGNEPVSAIRPPFLLETSISSPPRVRGHRLDGHTSLMPPAFDGDDNGR